MNNSCPTNDLVTIIIPCYRQAHFLSRAIQSCIEQTYQNIEIIVVDDGSPDNVLQVVAPYKNKIKLIQQMNQGLSAARNTGIRSSTGRFIKFLDADDWLLSKCIEEQYYSIFMFESFISVIGHSLYNDKDNTISGNIYPDFDRLIHKLCYINLGPPHAFLFPAQAVKDIGGFDTCTRVNGGHEDYDLLCRLAIKGLDVIAVHKIGCVYRQYEKSMSTNMQRMSESRSNVWQYFSREVLNKEPDSEVLIHIIGGYVWRLTADDFRYECTDILEESVSRLKIMISALTYASTIALCIHLSNLYKRLPRARDDGEKFRRQLSIKLADDLLNIALSKIQDKTIIKTKPIHAILVLLNSILWVERGFSFRRVFSKMQLIRIPLWIIKLFFAFIKIPSYFLPTKTEKGISKKRLI
jgi:glycosyltransferase involved in cell wall biosynthesis